MSVHFSTDSVPKRSQLECWREAVCSTFIHLDIAPHADHGPGFSGRILQHTHKVFGHAELYADAHRAVRSVGHSQRLDEDFFMVLIQRAGDSQIEQDGRSVLMKPGQFTVCDSTRTYSMTLPTRFHHEVIKVPGCKLRKYVSRPERLTAKAIDGTTGIGRFFLEMVDTCRHPASELTERLAEGVSDSLVNLLSLSLDSAIDPWRKPSSSLEVYHRRRVKDVIAKRLFDPDLRVEAIAKEVKLSSRYVHQLFSEDGSSLSSLIWDERLASAKRMLSSPSSMGLSITEIAHSVGFKDSAHFSRMFRSEFNCSPREFRKAALMPI